MHTFYMVIMYVQFCILQSDAINTFHIVNNLLNNHLMKKITFFKISIEKDY